MPKDYISHCVGCPYEGARHLPQKDRKIRALPLSMENNQSLILLVFQAPGINEWREGKPVISTVPSSAGSRLVRAFQKIGTSRQDYNITNTVQCFPGKLDTKLSNKPRDKSPVTLALRCCSMWLRQDIEGGEYNRIIVFGSHAHKAVRELGYYDSRFKFLKHPTGGLKNVDLYEALG